MPAGPTYEPIATTTLGSAAATITFSSIPATYTDLRLVLVGIGSLGSDVRIRFNSDTGTNYSYTELDGNGIATQSTRATSQTFIKLTTRWGISDTVPTMHVTDVFSYAGSTNKTILNNLSGDFNGTGSIEVLVGLWRSTSAINAITYSLSSGNFSTGTTATLYGIKAA